MPSDVATLPQAIEILEYVRDQRLSTSVFQMFRDRGIISTMLMCDPHTVDLQQLRIFLKIERITKGYVHRDDWAPKMLLQEGSYPFFESVLQPNGVFRWLDFKHQTPNSRTQGDIEFHDVHFNRPINRKKIVERLSGWNLRPADLTELLSFGLTQASWGRKEGDQIYRQCYAALNSWIKSGDKTLFPAIYHNSDRTFGTVHEGRYNDSCDGPEFPPYVHFLAVGKHV